MKKAFTIIELIVSMAIIAILLAGSGFVFRTVVKAERTARATSEISRKLKGITDRINADFEGLCKDGEIMAVWMPNFDASTGRYARFDRIMFYASGNFSSYLPVDYSSDDSVPIDVPNSIARISYMLASVPNRTLPVNIPVVTDPYLNNIDARGQEPKDRILARTQHICSNDPVLAAYEYCPDLSIMPVGATPPAPPYTFTEVENNLLEYDTMTMAQWMLAPWEYKDHMITVVTDVPAMQSEPIIDGGPTVDLSNPASSAHLIFCEGVGEFSIQGWYEAEQRWVPEIDPDNNGVLTDTDFFVDPGDPTMLDGSANVAWMLYPYDGSPELYGGQWIPKFLAFPNSGVTEANFNNIPGLGRAIKFTFTLYDSYGVFEDGKTFTHIVYLD